MIAVAGIGFAAPPRNSAIERSASFAARSQAARSTIESARSPTPPPCDARLRRHAVR